MYIHPYTSNRIKFYPIMDLEKNKIFDVFVNYLKF